MLVRLIGPGLKLGEQWHYEGETVKVSKIEYKRNKKYLEVIEEDIEEEEKTEVKDNEEQIKDSMEKTESDNETDEIEKLREQAKLLGVKSTHLMGKDKLIEKIEEATSPKFGEENNNDEIEEEEKTEVKDNEE